MSEETQEVTTEEPGLEIDPAAIEAEMLQAAQERSQDPTEMAATMYQLYVPHFKAGLSKLSTRALRRVINNAVLYPLEQDTINVQTEFEKQMTQMINSLLEAKFIMIMSTFAENAEKIYQASQSELTPEESKEIEAEIEASKE